MNTTERKAVDVLAVRDMADTIADAVRLLELPEFRALVDAGEFSFPARTVVSRLMSDYVMLVGWADDVAELIEAATNAARVLPEGARYGIELRAALASAQGGQ